MKKFAVLYTGILLAMTAVLAVVGVNFLKSGYQNEIRMAQTITGAVTSVYPQAESLIAETIAQSWAPDGDKTAAGRNTEADRENGAAILGRYGYEEEAVSKNHGYGKAVKSYLRVLLISLIFMLFCGYLLPGLERKKKKAQEDEVLSILEDCLSGRFEAACDEQRLEDLENPAFAGCLKKLVDSLRIKTEYLEAEHDNTKTLVTDISHQLKTPISAMKACFSMYLEAESETEKEEFLSRSRIQMDKLEALAFSLIQISRLETGVISLQKEEVLLTEILIGAVNTVYHKALEKQIHIETEEFEEHTLFLDRKWTEEALANILDNAVKYSPAGSSVRIRVQKLCSFLRIEIEDQGIGVLRDEQNRIFRRFYRGEEAAVRNQEGSGVGLYLTRKILEEQGGCISVRPAGRAGSIFVVQLPL